MLLEKIAGVHRDAPVPLYHSRTARKMLASQGYAVPGASLANVQATATRAEATFSRQEDLFNRKVVSQQAYDDALMTRDNARSSLAFAA